ncbi:hypothetical protein MPH_07827 [Macrophomina phaseolina MS6]|uniref:5-Methylcytosine G/T mismatch-specific DNA glycosylase n=1 Tax=Macrophomina phaseolina (strain MS6) TaxID=1126212 RepID=K2RQ63_MACPH|nr:hypothetical protein MPH_07827 [Macrophomina phaseolina MS6]
MSSKDSDVRRRRKDRESDLDSPRSKDKERKKPSHKKKPRSKDRLRDSEDRDRPPSTRSHSHSKKMSLVPELDRRPSTASPAVSRSYPSFSKAHSRESLEPRDADANAAKTPYTPDPTDLGGNSKDGRLSPKPTSATRAAGAPPSPPLTADEPDLRRKESGNSMRRSGGSQRSDRASRKRSESGRRSSSGRRSVGGESQRGSGPKTASKSSLRQNILPDDDSQDSDASRPSTARNHATFRKASSESSAARSQRTVSGARSTTDSDATSIAPDQARVRKDPIPDSSPSVDDSLPRTPTSTHPAFATMPGQKGTPMVQIFQSPNSRAPSADPWGGGMNAPPPPPPPPPPMMMPNDVPRVDYLLQNGGLSHTVPKTLVAAVESPLSSYRTQYGPPGTRPPPAEQVRHIFAPFQKLLEDYTHVMSKNGSIAVATGYRSVARRLLDRLEAVFARDISSEVCRCVMCRLRSDDVEPTDEETGVSWGEILEFVSGRRELPPWPPFTIDADAGGLGISGFNQAAPMQKLDIDVPEEYRDHYIKQSKKTKQAVQSWLATQPEIPTSPPQEVDDETLTFAMLTHLEADKRPIFTALLRGLTTIPASRSPTPLNIPRPELLVKTASALQRLYRLNKPPRDPECAIFLLNHPNLHSVLATLAAVSNGEWEILISGRFDGFLWSGAEGPVPPSTYGGSSISRGATATPLSRTTTPFSTNGGPSRGPTPFQSGTPGFGRSASTAPSSFGAPVQMDEEVEIATLAEVEREIFLGMEALEDAFESLHCKAEAVRRALRERSAGLAMAAQARRGSMDGGVEVRLGTPASGVGGWGPGGWETETDDGLDERSELAPDDSASNISYNRRRRPERRKQRNTPAPVEEEDESDLTEDAQRRR